MKKGIGLMLLLLVPAMAGCFGASSEQKSSGDEVLLAHDASGMRDVPAAFNGLAYSIHPTGYRRGEPTIAVATDGTIFTVGEQSAVIRSRDHGETWQVLEDGIAEPATDIDPFIWLDNATGRLFNSRLTVDCVLRTPIAACATGSPIAGWVAWTDNQGTSWAMNPAVGIPNVDHQKITTGPPPAGVATDGYPNLLYFVYNAFSPESVADAVQPIVATEGVRVAVSADGGKTFTRDALALPQDYLGGIASPVAVAADGTAYLAKHTPDGVAVARSTDGGASWTRVVHLDQHGTGWDWVLDPMMDVDDAGNAYVVWQGEGGDLWLSHSADGGDSWSVPVMASLPSMTSTVFPDIVAGVDGRVAIAYIGTSSPVIGWNEGDYPPNDPSYADDATVWNLYVAHILDATSADPLIVTAPVTTDDDPVQRGCIWHHGGSNPCRNLRDFMDMVEHDGNVYVVYPDGCKACATAGDSHVLGETTVVIQRAGPLLRDIPPITELPLPGVPAGLDEPVEYEFTGHVNFPGCYAETDPALDAAVRDRVEFEFEVPASTRYVNGTLDWTTHGPANPATDLDDLDVLLYDAQGDYFDTPDGVPETFTFELREGDQGTWTALVMNCENPPTDFTLDLVLE